MKYRLGDIIDLDQFRAMMRSFYAATGIPHGLMDYAAPVIIDDEHLATMFLGQLFHEAPDMAFFRALARQLDLEGEEYLSAIRAVPVIPREQVEAAMGFYSQMAQMLAANGLDRLHQRMAEERLAALNRDLTQWVQERTAQLLERNHLLSAEIIGHTETEAALLHEKRFSDDIIDSLPGVFYMIADDGRFVRWNTQLTEVSGFAGEALQRKHPLDFFAGEDKARIADAIRRCFDEGEAFIEATFITRTGRCLPYYFSGRRTLAEGRAYLVGLGIDITDRVRLQRELEVQAHTDPLTGVHNRRYFLELAETELARMRRYGKPLSLLMLDLDHFKAINDTHGHHAGDAVLRALGEVCRGTLRTADMVGRVGGEEFAILLPETDIRQAVALAERLRSAIADIAVPLGRGGTLRFTASIGVTGLAAGDTDLDGLLNLADRALYAAKHAGRNRVASHAAPATAHPLMVI